MTDWLASVRKALGGFVGCLLSGMLVASWDDGATARELSVAVSAAVIVAVAVYLLPNEGA